MMMLNETKREILRSNQFRKDLRLSVRQGKDIKLLEKIIIKLANDEPLPENHRDRALKGNWIGHRECHVTPDWLLVYRKSDNDKLLLMLIRLASHSNLDF
jgi:mRNA interferase YafQ